MIKAVIFDLDDTLYNEIDYVDQAFMEVAKVVREALLAKWNSSGDSIITNGAYEIPGMSNSSDGAAEIPGASDISDGMMDIPSASNIQRRMKQLMEKNGRGHIFNDVCEEYQLEMDIPKLVEIYHATKPVLHLYPDAEQILYYLEYHQIKTGVITDGCAQVQREKMNALGLMKRMGCPLASYDLPIDEEGNVIPLPDTTKPLEKHATKPNPGVYKYVCDQLGVRPEEAIYVGDNPLKDFVGAKKIGMKTVYIIRPEGDHIHDVAPGPEYEAEYTIHNLLELQDLL